MAASFLKLWRLAELVAELDPVARAGSSPVLAFMLARAYAGLKDDDVGTLARAGLNATTLYAEVRVQERLGANNWPWVIFRALKDVEKRKGVALSIKSDLVD